MTSNLHLCGQSPCREGCILHPARGKFCMFEIVPDRYPAARARPRPLVEVPVPRALRMRPTAPTRSSRRETDRGLLPLPIDRPPPSREGCTPLPVLLSPPPAATSTLFYPDRYPAARARPWPHFEVPVPRALRMRPTVPARPSRRETDRGLLPLQPIALPLPLSPPPAASQTWSCCRRRSRCPSSFVCRPSHLSPRASVGAVIRWRSSD